MKKNALLQTVRSDGSIDRPKSKPRTDLLDISIRDEINLYHTALSDWRPTPDMESAFVHFMSNKMYTAACALIMLEKDVTFNDIIEVYTLGVPKYGDESWKKVRPVRTFLSSALRHAVDGPNSEDYGLPHWVHCCWNLIALRWFEKEGLVPERD